MYIYWMICIPTPIAPIGARLEYIHMLREMMICRLATMGFRLDWDVRLNTDWNPTWLQV